MWRETNPEEYEAWLEGQEWEEGDPVEEDW